MSLLQHSSPSLSSSFSSAFGTSTERVYYHTKSDSNLYKIARLRAETKIRKTSIRFMLLENDAAVTLHSEPGLWADRQQKTNVLALRHTTRHHYRVHIPRLDHYPQPISGRRSQQMSERLQRIGKAAMALGQTTRIRKYCKLMSQTRWQCTTHASSTLSCS